MLGVCVCLVGVLDWRDGKKEELCELSLKRDVFEERHFLCVNGRVRNPELCSRVAVTGRLKDDVLSVDDLVGKCYPHVKPRENELAVPTRFFVSKGGNVTNF